MKKETYTNNFKARDLRDFTQEGCRLFDVSCPMKKFGYPETNSEANLRLRLPSSRKSLGITILKFSQKVKRRL